MIARALFHEPKTAPIAPQSCSCGSCGEIATPSRLRIRSLNSSTSSRRSSALRSVSISTPRARFLVSRISSNGSCSLLLRLQAEHDVAVHLHEAAVRVPGEAGVARRGRRPSTVSSLRPRLRTVSIMPGIEARAPERTETSSGIRAVAEASGRRCCSTRARCVGDLLPQRRRIGPAVGVVVGADLGRDREARRHRQPEAGHLGEVGALAAEQVLHVGAAVGARRRRRSRRTSPCEPRCASSSSRRRGRATGFAPRAAAACSRRFRACDRLRRLPARPTPTSRGRLPLLRRRSSSRSVRPPFVVLTSASTARRTVATFSSCSLRPRLHGVADAVRSQPRAQLREPGARSGAGSAASSRGRATSPCRPPSSDDRR